MGKRTKARRRGGEGVEVQADAKAAALETFNTAVVAAKTAGVTPEELKAEIDKVFGPANAISENQSGGTDEAIVYSKEYKDGLIAALVMAVKQNLTVAIEPLKDALKRAGVSDTDIAAASTPPVTLQTGTTTMGGFRGGENIGWSLGGDLPSELVGGYHHGKRHNGHKSKKGKRGGGLSYSLLGGRRRKTGRKSGRKSVRKH